MTEPRWQRPINTRRPRRMGMDNVKKNILLFPFNLLYRVSPVLDLKLLFLLKTGRRLNLNNPASYNEKMQWIKLYDRNPLMAKCCDKYAVREYVTSAGCGELLNELYWEGFDPGDIPFDDLPDRFVIKVTHGSTFNIICTDKSRLDRGDAVKKCRRWLGTKFLPCYGEWFYGVVKPRVVVERYLEGEAGLPMVDYKFFCFHGEPKLIHVGTWNGAHAINAYDMDFTLLPGVRLGYPNDDWTPIARPPELEQMLAYARRLSKDFLHVRVDLYCSRGKIYFGELTFTKGSGFGKIEPYEFDLKMGSWLTLPLRSGAR
jgi:hypothetical protein